ALPKLKPKELTGVDCAGEAHPVVPLSPSASADVAAVKATATREKASDRRMGATRNRMAEVLYDFISALTDASLTDHNRPIIYQRGCDGASRRHSSQCDHARAGAGQSS